MRHSSVKTHTLPERGERFAHWLGRRFFQETHKTQNPETLKSSLVNFETQARFEGHAQPVFLRVGSVDEKIYINLCNKNWKYVEIGLNDWKVIDNPPVRFRRVARMKELPTPIKGDSIDKFRDYLNVGSDLDFVLAVSWILATLRSHGPYPIMVLNGEMGSSKSTLLLIVPRMPLWILPLPLRALFVMPVSFHAIPKPLKFAPQINKEVRGEFPLGWSANECQ